MGKKTGAKRIPVILVAVIIFLFFSSIPLGLSSLALNEPVKIFENNVNEINLNMPESLNNVINHIRTLSSFQSRVPGYPGHQEAANYIVNKFKEYGLEPGGENGYLQYFNLTIPVDLGTEIKIPSNGQTFKAYPLWPNLIQTCKTPEEGLTGKLIYVGTGSLSELNGLDLEGAIALMEFNSKRNWLNLVKLGAKAVIFIEPEYTTRIEAESKFLLTPLYFPRLYVQRDVGETLKDLAKNNTIVQITSNMVWKQIKDQNIIGIIPGEKYPNDVIVLTAHYDTWSIVPHFAPGADDASGIAALLEMARLLKKYPPSRTVMFVALSGHWEGLAGAREFVEYYYFSEAVQNGTIRPWIFINYDFSSDSNRIGYLGLGGGTWTGLVGGTFMLQRYLRIYRIFANTYLPALREKGYDTSLITSGEGFDYPIPTSSISDIEPAILTGTIAFAFRTTYSLRIGWNTPFSTFNMVIPENLEPQLTFAFYISLFIANQEDFGVEWKRPFRGYETIAEEQYGFNIVVGDVVVYDRRKGFYTNEPLLRDELKILVVATLRYSLLDPFSKIITMADKNGTYRIVGVPGYRCSNLARPPEFGASATTHSGNVIDLSAYVMNETTGKIVYAKDLGAHGESTYPSMDIYGHYQWWVPFPTFVRIVVFKCGTLVLTDIINPTNLKAPKFNINTRDALEPFLLNIEVRSHEGHIPLEMYGMISPPDTYEDLALIFIPVEFVNVRSVEFILKYGKSFIIKGLLMNSTKENPEGTGYFVQGGEQKVITLTPIHIARSLFYLNDKRLKDLHSFNVWVPISEEQHELARENLQKAEYYLERKDYEKAYLYSMLTWSYEVMPYHAIFGTIQQVLITTVFFSILLIPFSFMLEKILFDKIGKIKIALISVIYIITYLIFSYLNPGTTLATNSVMVMIGFITLILAIFTFYVLVNGFINVLKMFRTKLIGPHFVTSKFASVASASWSVGVGNMRRRKTRTLLLLITLTLTFSGLVSLTSISVLSVTQIKAEKAQAPYNGMLIKFRREEYVERVSDLLPKIIGNALENAIVSPRSYIIFPYTETMGFPHAWVKGTNGSTTVKAMVGFTPQESNVSHIDAFLKDGRWFQGFDKYVTIISEKLSASIGAEVGDEINILGLRLKVIGIVSEEIDYYKDIDGSSLSPKVTAVLEEGPAKFQIISLTDTILVPYKLARDLDGKIFSIAVKSENKTQMLILADHLNTLSQQEYQVTVFFNGSLYKFGYVKGLSIKGTSLFLMPLIISVLIIFNTVLGSVYERKREISILSLVGLAPSEISMMFIAEAAEYAILSVVIGYLGGIMAAKILLQVGVLPLELFPQFTSTSMLIAMSIFILIVMCGSIYPSILSGRLVSPSRRRRWEIPEPVGNIWEINMPFIVDEEEMIGFLSYLGNYLKNNPQESFEIETISIQEETIRDRKINSLYLEMRLAPFATQTIQKVIIRPVPEKGNKMRLQCWINLISGIRDVWKRSNRSFINVIRKQMLVWRSLEMNERLRYIRKPFSLD